MCGAGVDVVQLRDKAADDQTIATRGAMAAEAARDHGALFIVNDRPDLALAMGADGVHVGQEDAPPRECRALLGDGAVIGLSTHSAPELDESGGEPVDYVSVGPVAPTPTKPGRPGTGLGLVEHAAARCAMPFFVTGGVAPDTLLSMATAGARRFVVVRALTEAADPAAVARRLRALIDALD